VAAAAIPDARAPVPDDGAREEQSVLANLRRELRRSMSQAMFICVGMALGIGVVITATRPPEAAERPGGSVAAIPVRGGDDLTVPATRQGGERGLVRLKQQISQARSGKMRPATKVNDKSCRTRRVRTRGLKPGSRRAESAARDRSGGRDGADRHHG